MANDEDNRSQRSWWSSFRGHPGEGLFDAVKHSDLKKVRKLLGQGATLDYRDRKTGGTALHAAVERGCRSEVVRFLIEQMVLEDGGNGLSLKDKHGQVRIKK
ncbi:unnamed protein product [Heterosigma akashiwo]